MDMTQLNDYTTRSEAVCRRNDTISPRLYEEYGVKKGLRDENGNGVLAGLTNISKITSSKIVDGKKIPCDGQLWYRGYRVEDLIGSLGETELGYEKIAYLLLMGQMPDSAAAEEFRRLLGECRTLPTNFTRDVIMKAPGKDIMNSMTRGILTLASYDERAIDTSVSNSLRQCIQLIAEFPLLAVYGYHAYNYYENMDSMVIHRPDPALSTAENLLMMLRPDMSYTDLEARVLDIALILRRRQQFHLHHPCHHLLRFRHLFHHRGGYVLPERPQARRRQHQGHGNDGGHPPARPRLLGQGGSGGLSREDHQ